MYRYKTEPLDHQKRILNSSWSEEEWGLFCEMGTGKSKITIDNAAYLYEKGAINAMIIIAPKGNYANWLPEIEKHLPDRIERKVVLWQSNRSATKKFRNEIKSLYRFDGMRILVMNVESLSSKKFSNEACRVAWGFVTTHRCFFAVDESTTVKTESSARTKSCVRLAKQCSFRRILTGTPVTETPLDLWGQLDVLTGGDPHRLIQRSSYWGFRNHYCTQQKVKIPGQRAFRKVTGYRNLDELSEVLQTFSSRVTKDDCLDLPPKQYSTYSVPLTPDQQKIYDQVREEILIEFAGGRSLTIPIAISRIMRLRQVLSGFLPVDPPEINLLNYQDDIDWDGEEILEIPEKRTAALLDVLQETQGKVIVWACFRRTIDKLVSVLGKEYGRDSVAGYSGGTKQADRISAVERFQEPTDPLRFLVANRAGAYGLTLTAARTAIYYENDWSLEVRMQSEDRCHRIGTNSSVSYVDLVAPGTVDARVVSALREKKEISQIVMGEEVTAWL